jgi:Restriction endonuclease
MVQPKRQIFDRIPPSWRDLQICVAQVFSEIGCKVHTGAKVDLPRGTVELDVFVRDITTVPHSNYVCECKNWSRRVPKSVVHSFRTVISELGANRGFLISRIGFQSGARDAAQFTNIDLLSWRQFEELIFDRWIDGITQRLNPLFASAHVLMDPHDEDLWKLRECTEESWNEWTRICQRYPLITVWAGYHWHSHVGLEAIPSLRLTDDGVLSENRTPKVLDTYRKVVDAAPAICHRARQELEKFWGIRAVGPIRVCKERES